MYAGPESWSPTTIDFEGDDYWGHNSEDCMDISHSGYLVGNQPPPSRARTSTAIRCRWPWPGVAHFRRFSRWEGRARGLPSNLPPLVIAVARRRKKS